MTATRTAFRNTVTVAIAATVFTLSVLAAPGDAAAGKRKWQHGHGHGHGDFTTGLAIGLGVTLLGHAIASGGATRDPVVTRRCQQAKEWMHLARAAERMAAEDRRRGDLHGARFMKREAKRRRANARRARQDCKDWHRN